MSDHAEVTFDTSVSTSAHTSGYLPLVFEDGFHKQELPALLAQAILNQVTSEDLSITKWKSKKRFNVNWHDSKQAQKSLTIDFYALVESLKKNRSYLHTSFNLPPIPFTWFDQSLEMGLNSYAPNSEGTGSMTFQVGTNLGTMYPILPAIDREGFASGSFQTTLEKILLLYRNDCVNHSSFIFSFHDGVWLSKLLAYLNTLVSSFEITMIQLYYKAKHDETFRNANGWTFDEVLLGSTVTGRTMEKLKWVHLITGKHLEDLSAELHTFDRIKGVRNHLNHFDPPIFACTIEDAAAWVNGMFDVAMLLLKIRRAIGAGVSSKLVEILLQPPVRFEPFDPAKTRLPQNGTGYASCFNEYKDSNSIKMVWD